MKFQDIKVDDVVTRMLAGTVAMNLKVSEISEKLIHCGPWTFSRQSGAEIDDELGWGEKGTGSFLVLSLTNMQNVAKVDVETESGSIYHLDKEEMTWEKTRANPNPNSWPISTQPVRTPGGKLLRWPVIEPGKGLELIGPPLDSTADYRKITTTWITRIIKYDKKPKVSNPEKKQNETD